MKRTLMLILLIAAASASASAQFQFRAAGNVLNPISAVPYDSDSWLIDIENPEDLMTGWHWEVLLHRFGFGMHYAIDLQQPDSAPATLDWKGDFFLSYHPFGAGSFLDPFFEFGWGDAGSTIVDDISDADYPDWKDAARNDDTRALTLYSYVAAGLAIDLSGLLLGAKASYTPYAMQSGVAGSGIPALELPQFELALFAGIALGSH
jgi:hypothetical protein